MITSYVRHIISKAPANAPWRAGHRSVVRLLDAAAAEQSSRPLEARPSRGHAVDINEETARRYLRLTLEIAATAKEALALANSREEKMAVPELERMYNKGCAFACSLFLLRHSPGRVADLLRLYTGQLMSRRRRRFAVMKHRRRMSERLPNVRGKALPRPLWVWWRRHPAGARPLRIILEEAGGIIDWRRGAAVVNKHLERVAALSPRPLPRATTYSFRRRQAQASKTDVLAHKTGPTGCSNSIEDAHYRWTE